jgi:hypothetical protein
MAVTYPTRICLTGRSAALGASTEIALVISAGLQSKVTLKRIKVKRVSGTAITFRPLLTSATGAAVASFAQEWFAAAATAVANLMDTASGQPTDNPMDIPMITDSAGKLYLTPGPNAGADNVFDYLVIFEINR